MNNPNHENLKSLNRIRWIAIVGQCVLILFATYYLEILLPLEWLSGLVVLELFFQFYSWRRVNNFKLVSSNEVALHIVFDALILTALVYFSGGPNNPFIYLMLLSVALGTLMLTSRDLVIVTSLQLLLYSFLNIYQRPLELGDSSPLASFHMHLMGMWVNFVLTVILIAAFGYFARQSLLQKEHHIRQLREKQLRDEQVLSLGIISANAAHELGTPLSTMSIVLDDLKHESLPESLQPELDLLIKQIANCRQIIEFLSEKSQRIRIQLQHESTSRTDNRAKLSEQLKSLVENWLVYRPQIVLQQNWTDESEQIAKSLPITVEQAITNLLDNAADASLANACDQIQLKVYVKDKNLMIDIHDGGKGIAKEIVDSATSLIQNTQKAQGLGWGLFLSNVSIERVGGQVQMQSLTENGTTTRISIPMDALI